ncbi:MAG: hypothetical protein ABIJ56_03095 [Pseudomonadota bacterium]
MSEPQAYVPELQGNPGTSEEPAAQQQPSDPAVPPECVSDGDCALSDLPGCCDCCGCTEKPYAAPIKQIENWKAKCAAKKCDKKHCVAVDCPPCLHDFPADGAACTDGKCVVRDAP